MLQDKIHEKQALANLLGKFPGENDETSAGTKTRDRQTIQILPTKTKTNRMITAHRNAAVPSLFQWIHFFSRKNSLLYRTTLGFP